MATFILKYPAGCRRCGARLPAGTAVKWHHVLGVECFECRFGEIPPRAAQSTSDDHLTGADKTGSLGDRLEEPDND